MTHALLIERITRSLAYMLRHKPEEFDLRLDREGFADLGEVVQALNERLGEPIEEEDVEEAIGSGDRPRYEIRGERIRALYGHSIDVDPGPSCKPPEFLYVGMGSRDADRALRHGLNGGRRRFLHLAITEEEALEMGRRLARDYVVMTVHALDAWEEDIDFYDRKAIFLSGPIPREFLSLGEVHHDGEDPRDRVDSPRSRTRPERGVRERGSFQEPSQRGRPRESEPVREARGEGGRSPSSGGRPGERPRESSDDRPRHRDRDRREGAERPQRPGRPERHEQPERQQSAERPARAERGEQRSDRPEPRPDRGFDRPERGFGRPEKGEPRDLQEPREERRRPPESRPSGREPERRAPERPREAPAARREGGREQRHHEPASASPSAPGGFGLGIFEPTPRASRPAPEDRPPPPAPRREDPPPSRESAPRPEESGPVFGAGL